MIPFNIDSYAMAALSFHAVFMASYLLTATAARTDYLKLLGCTFLMLAGWYCSSFMEEAGIFAQAPWLIEWPTLFIPLFAPCLYFYVRAVSSPTPWDFRRQPKAHWYLALAIILLELPITLSSGDIKALQIGEGSSTPEGWSQIAITLGWVSTALLMAQFATYIALSVRRITKHAVRIRHLFSNLENRTLIWLRNYLIMLCLLWGLGLTDFINLPNEYGWLAHVLWIVTFSHLSLRQKPVFSTPEHAAGADGISQKTDDEKTSRTTLPEDSRTRIADKLRTVMEKDHLYRDADLTLRKLSDKIGVTTHHISETLREEIGQNFYDYVNGCRIAEACDLLKATNDAVIDVAFAVGFNSRSTFSAAFKKHTDTSPATFRKNGSNLS